MARLPRLQLPGHAHYLIQRTSGSPGERKAFVDAIDRSVCLSVLRESASAVGVQVHAYALLDNELQLLATPNESGGLGHLMQAVGRRYVSAYNRRHQHRGSLWDGRFRCAVIEPGAFRLSALLLVDGQSAELGVSSAAHRLGLQRDTLLADPPEFWALGNTPFEREVAYQALLARGLAASAAEQLRQAALGGWAAGSAPFAAQVLAATSRSALPRPRGRPRSLASNPPG